MCQGAKAVGRIWLFCKFGWVWVKMQRVKKNIKKGMEFGHFQPWFMLYAACKSTNLRVHQQMVEKKP